ncbi:MAG: hypothetical protein K5931_03915, partial [Lachnospiraceae bacterium]|nr:hypothetical protein [Lachnospiraceae bacterium]
GALEDGSGNKESEIKKFFEDIPSREYVPLSKGEADPEEEKAPEASDEPKEEKQVLDSDEEKASLDTEESKKAKE